MSINLSDSTPAAASGRTNVTWQKDSSGNVSASVANSAVTSVAGRTGAVTLASGDVSGLAASATTDTTNAGNISSGTLGAARLPLATTGAFGAVKPDGTTVTITSGVISAVTATPTAPSFTTLTDGSTVTWATSGAWVNNATLTMAHGTSTRAINLTGLVAGATGTLIVKQDSTGGAALTFGTNSGAYTNKVIGGGSGAVTITTAASAVDILTWVYDGTSVFWTQGKNYN